MRRLLYILISLCLVFNTNAQTTLAPFHGAYQVQASGGGGGCDADATTWITAIQGEGITFSAPRQALACSLYTAMKAHGYYSKIKAFHWNGWSNANGNKYNLVNPVNSDGAYRATYTGSPTHGSTGIAYNGSSQYADLKIKPDAMGQNSITIITYISTIATSGSDNYHTGAWNTVTGSRTGIGRATNTLQYFLANSGNYTATTTNGSGLLGVNRTSSIVMKAFRDAVQVGSTYTTASVAPNSYNILSGGITVNGTPIASGNTVTVLMTLVADGFTDAEWTDFYNDFTTFRTGW